MANWRDGSDNRNLADWGRKASYANNRNVDSGAKKKYSGSNSWRDHEDKAENDDRGRFNDAFDRRQMRSTNERQPQKVRPIPSFKLSSILRTSSETQMIQSLSFEENGFLVLLDQQNIPPETMCQIFGALAKASKSSSVCETVQSLLFFFSKIISKLDGDENFLREIKLYIINMTGFITEGLQSQREKHIQAVTDLLVFLHRLEKAMPQKSFAAVSQLVQLIKVQVESMNRKGNYLMGAIAELLEELNASMTRLKKIQVEVKKAEALVEPPNDFREISIYPGELDMLSCDESFIRKNLVEGKYVGGVDHYLDVQFRLLREDFIRPLRNGIKEYHRQGHENGSHTKYIHVKDLHVYHDVRMIGSVMYNTELVNLCEFDCTPFRNLRWECSKRLMNGSLVCLSSDGFQTFYLGTIGGERSAKLLSKGRFHIKFDSDTAMPDMLPLARYVMIESPVYFEAYRHNLKVLQNSGEGNFPLEKYFVHVDKVIAPPSYLRRYPEYSFAIRFGVDMFYNQRWPIHEISKLNESQSEAFHAALTKQLVVIQGPPGTGKTHVGALIVQALLKNTEEWPILVVCYTNHALDQFLEKIKIYCDGDELIRIGGKSKSEEMQRFNLSEIRSRQKLYGKERYQYYTEMSALQNRISRREKQLELLDHFVLGAELSGTIRKNNQTHYEQLCLMSSEGSLTEGILKWLGYAVNSASAEDIEDAATTSEDVSQNVEEIDEEEIKEMEEKRCIDTDADFGQQADQLRASAVEEMNRRMESMSVDSDAIHVNQIVALQQVDEDGFVTVQRKTKSQKQQFLSQLRKAEAMTENDSALIDDINSLSQQHRWNLYKLWIELYVQNIQRRISMHRDSYGEAFGTFQFYRNKADIEIVRSAKIIGMTTTGAAKYRHIIDGIKPKITIVEEAAEVLEAHIVTALCKETDHLILIGDHLQLRPNPAVHELARKFNLEISLFERLIKNDMEYFQLKQQHRMRPCISSLLVPLIYKQLLDHPSVEQYEDVKGIASNMFFVNHHEEENALGDTRSHMNMHEATFIVELCRYVILQGYDASQVTILTTYSGQLMQIRKLMKNYLLLQDVRATVVDNYQGEECDIILLSFVRSNEEGNIGFLKTPNRVNVALSRARKGLYCIGNFDCLRSECKLWTELMANLEDQNATGNALSLFCQNHNEYKTMVKSKDDFHAVPEGGCMRPCNVRMDCGHSCPSVCHIVDEDHEIACKNCSKDCGLFIDCEQNHRCRRKCHFGEECGSCMVLVDKLRPDCQHIVRYYCSEDPSSAVCHSDCERNRSCGHKCSGKCYEKCDNLLCRFKVEVKAPCGHIVTIRCSNATDEFELLSACTAPCYVELKCGHLCKGSCGQCKYGRLHMSCAERCNRILICGHICPDSCSVECAPCKQRCSNECVHSACQLRCGDPCLPCREACSWQCEHLQCSNLCFQPCDRQLCLQPDTRLIEKCGHPSIGVCGEKMPSLCRICDKDEVEEIFFGNEDAEDARFIQLEDCNHIIEVNGLIQWMESKPDSSEPNSNDGRNSIQFKKCPKCNTIIRHTKALNTYIQASLRDIQQVKLKTRGDPKENETRQSSINEKVNQIISSSMYRVETVPLRPLYVDVYEATEFGKRRVAKPKQILIGLTNKFDLIDKLRKICLNFENRNKDRSNVSSEVIESFEARIQMAAAFIRSFQNSEQQRDDISTEISFLELMGSVIAEASKQQLTEDEQKTLADAFGIANQYGAATESIREKFKELMTKALQRAAPLGITSIEKEMILKAMDFKPGHWYKCPNGHVYCITECGGAMETSKCPDCGSAIGGTNHSLDQTNALATEMDGATAPAWPTNLMAFLRPFMD